MLENNITIEELVAFAKKLAHKGGEVIQQYFRQPYDMAVKSDQSPVTIADRHVEEVMREMISEHYPSHQIIGEEHDDKITDDDTFCWVLDPIDGTRAFTCGIPTFGSLISLLHHQQPLIGIINQPISNEMWSAVTDTFAHYNNKVVHTRKITTLADAIFAYAPPGLKRLEDYQRMTQLAEQTRHTALCFDCYSYGMLANGYVDIIVQANLKPYDFLPLVPIIHAAGGIMTDWQGNALTLQSGPYTIAAGNPAIHEQALKWLNS